MLMTAIAFWTLAYTFEVAAGSYETKLFWARLQYLGILAVPPMWLVFSLAYADRKDWLKSRTYALLAIEPVIILALVWTNDSHHLIWLQTEYISWSMPLVYLYGSFFWIHAAYTYCLLLLGSLLLIHTVMRSSIIHQGQAFVLLIGLLAPWLANLIYLADVNPFPPLDLTPFAFTITGLAVGWGLLRHHLLDIVPIARNAVVESMRDAVIVIDPQNRIIDLNPVALQASNYKNGEFVGKSIGEVFPNWRSLIDRFLLEREFHDRVKATVRNEQRIFDIKIAPLQSRPEQFSSRVVIISDITDWVKSEEALAISEKSYQDLYDSMNEGLALHELVYNQSGEAVDYKILDVNPAFERIIGISRAEALGCWASVLYDTKEPPFLDTYARVVKSNESYTFDEWFEPF